MKKQITALSIALIISTLTSCGAPNADNIGVDSLIVNVEQTEQLQINKKIDPTIGDATIITFPITSDLDGYEFEFDKISWDRVVVAQLSYGSELKTILKRETPSSEKVSDIVKTILSLGALKGKSYRKLKQVQNKEAEVSLIVEPMIAKLLKKFPCYKIKDNKRKCKLVKDQRTSQKPKYAKNCGALKRSKKKFLDLTEREDLALGVKQCQKLSGQKIYIAELRKKVEDIRLSGKYIGVGLVVDYSEYAGFIGLPVVNSKATKDGGFTSTIKFNDTRTKIEKLSLGINFGNGFKEFSLLNGGISNLRYGRTQEGATFLRFSINGLYKIDAELSVTMETIYLDKTGKSYSNIRIVGTTLNYFADGVVRKGVMSLQIDTIN